MPTRRLIYRFQFLDNTETETINLKYHSEDLSPVDIDEDAAPPWTHLEHHQCSHCPLKAAEHKLCPLAASWSHIIDKFSDIVSHKELDLEVETFERTVYQRTSAQRALSSLLGFVSATSGCPHTAYLKPMAHFHLPLANGSETIMRSTGIYLLAQFIKKNNNQNATLELEGLKEIYQNIQHINRKMIDRIKSVATNDATINAIVSLDMLANLMPLVIDEQIEEVKHLFKAYLE